MEEFVPFDDFAGFGFTIEGHNAELWRPTFEFANPVGDGRIRHNNQCGECLERGNDVSDEADNLDCLPLRHGYISAVPKLKRYTYETHLVRKDAVLVDVPVVAQPIHTIDLEWHKLELGILPEVRLRVNGKAVLWQPLQTVLFDLAALTPGWYND